MIKDNVRIVVCCYCGYKVLEDGRFKSKFEGEGKACDGCGRMVKIIHSAPAPTPAVTINMN